MSNHVKICIGLMCLKVVYIEQSLILLAIQY